MIVKTLMKRDRRAASESVFTANVTLFLVTSAAIAATKPNGVSRIATLVIREGSEKVVVPYRRSALWKANEAQ